MADRYTPPADFQDCELGRELRAFGQIVLVMQGGGALGAYHGGVYEALHNAGVEPDWIVGTSIGAINGALIAGNPMSNRLERLKRFWQLIHYEWPLQTTRAFPFVGQATADLLTMALGNPEFFVPNPMAAISPQLQLGPEEAAYYSVKPLAKTLDDLIEADEFGRWPTRLTVGAAKVTTSEMVYFDSATIPLGIEHVLASGALPPAFPAVRIDGEIYWDGGILSNTPLEIVLDEHQTRPSLVFEVHLWNPSGTEPRSILEGLSREKDIRYSSRSTTAIARQREEHRLRHMIGQLLKRLPADANADPDVRRIALESRTTPCMHVVRLMAPTLDTETLSRDIDFSAEGIGKRWAAGLADMRRVLAAAPWRHRIDPMDGIALHEIAEGHEVVPLEEAEPVRA